MPAVSGGMEDWSYRRSLGGATRHLLSADLWATRILLSSFANVVAVEAVAAIISSLHQGNGDCPQRLCYGLSSAPARGGVWQGAPSRPPTNTPTNTVLDVHACNVVESSQNRNQQTAPSMTSPVEAEAASCDLRPARLVSPSAQLARLSASTSSLPVCLPSQSVLWSRPSDSHVNWMHRSVQFILAGHHRFPILGRRCILMSYYARLARPQILRKLCVAETVCLLRHSYTWFCLLGLHESTPTRSSSAVDALWFEARSSSWSRTSTPTSNLESSQGKARHPRMPAYIRRKPAGWIYGTRTHNTKLSLRRC